ATPDDVTGPVNLGNPPAFTILELARQIVALTKSGSSLRFAPLPQDDPVQRQPDISLAQGLIGWQPRIPLEEGLRRTIAYFSRILGESGGEN
ncbi:MAG: hypothetical protein N2Z74_05260, partial [Syntrophales bacterium]|nr:hypothetical protein [Syntrophales bacterium]